MATVNDLLKGIVASLEQTEASVRAVDDKFIQNDEEFRPTMIKSLLEKSSSSGHLEGMSLLSLKNEALLSYVNSLVLVLLSHVERLRLLELEDKVAPLKRKAVESSVQQRVTLEKGIKPLEKKLTYQLDKMVRSFHKMEEDNARMEQKVAEAASNGSVEDEEEENEDEEDEDEEDEEDEDDSDEDALSYKPDASALKKMAKASLAKNGKPAPGGKYRPPKISAAAPPTQFDDRAISAKSKRKLQSMEEYLRESSDLPQMEASIGATILGHGRGGVKTSRDSQKEREIQRYEESNFTRLPTTATKKTHRQQMAERANTFAGEDWSMFNNNRSLKEGTSRKRKGGSAWDRAKRSRH